MIPIWLYAGATLTIVAIAFGIGRIYPGMGVAFVALASTLWSAYVAYHHRALRRARCDSEMR